MFKGPLRVSIKRRGGNNEIVNVMPERGGAMLGILMRYFYSPGDSERTLSSNTDPGKF